MFELPWTTGSEDLYMKFNISWSPSPPNSSVRVEYPFRISKTFPKIALGCRTSSCSSYTSGSSAKKDCEKQPYCNEVCAQTKFNAQWNASSETCSMNFYLKSVCLKSTRDTAGNYRMRADSACFLHPGGISVYNFDLSKFNSFYHSEFPYIPQDDGSPAFYHFIRPTNGVQMEIRDSNDPIFFVANATSNSYTFSSTVDGSVYLSLHGIPMPSPTIAYPVSASAAMQPQTLTTYDTSSYLPPHASSTTQLQPSQPPYPVAQTPVYNYPPVAHSPVPVAPVTVTAAPYPDPNAQNRPVTPVSAPVPSLQPIPLTRPLSVFAPQFPSSYPSNQGPIPYPTPALSQSPGTGAMNPIAYPPQPGQPIYPGAANPIPYPQPQSQPHPNPLPMNPQNAPNPYQPSASNAPPYPTPPYPPSQQTYPAPQQTYPAPQQNYPGSGQNPPPYFSAMPPVTTNAVPYPQQPAQSTPPYPQMQMPSPMIPSSSAEPPMSPHSAPSAPPL
ncbi:hypothetical protein BKA69DRAFT_1041047 [Paraphysoderma sedebokerense]|nr:hypothetical protein BKA69DRAFT_1041047 [Paraphysoderma sedebokerense]